MSNKAKRPAYNKLPKTHKDVIQAYLSSEDNPESKYSDLSDTQIQEIFDKAFGDEDQKKEDETSKDGTPVPVLEGLKKGDKIPADFAERMTDRGRSLNGLLTDAAQEAPLYIEAEMAGTVCAQEMVFSTSKGQNMPKVKGGWKVAGSTDALQKLKGGDYKGIAHIVYKAIKAGLAVFIGDNRVAFIVSVKKDGTRLSLEFHEVKA